MADQPPTDASPLRPRAARRAGARAGRAPARFLGRTLAAALALLGAALPAGGPRAACADESRAARAETVEQRLNAGRRRAIERGCRWLVDKQHGGGSFGDDKALVAFTALSTLALLAEGSGIGRGPFGKEVAKAVEWLLQRVEEKPPAGFPEGYFHAPRDNSSKMHGQGYATLALASALGTADRNVISPDRIRKALKKAVACCENAQTVTGGWGYEPTPSVDHEGSVTVTVAHALRAARDAGVFVGQEHVKQGLQYLRNSQKLVGRGPATTSDEDDGSFKYSLNTEASSYALTAAAVSSIYLFGEYRTTPDAIDRIDKGVRYIKRRLASTLRDDGRFYHYGHFYAAWAAWQYDGDKPATAPGETWGDDPSSSDIEHTKQFWGPWHAKMYPVLIAAQGADGSWTPRSDLYAFGDLVPTAFSVLTLAVPDELLPVFQR